MPDVDSDDIPPAVAELLKKSQIAYLSVISTKGDLYSYPIAFYFTGQNIYFLTPTGSAKMKFLKANPKVSMVVDNKALTRDACGAMIQGEAKVFGVKQLFKSVLSAMSTTAHLSRKYPGMLTFYAKGKDLPDERKFYKYRFIRVKPTKILYWVGYKFGRYTPRDKPGAFERLFSDVKNDEKRTKSTLEAMSDMFESVDESFFERPLSQDEPWLQRLNESTSEGGVTNEERRIIQLFASRSSGVAPKVSDEERAVLRKWKASSPDSQVGTQSDRPSS